MTSSHTVPPFPSGNRLLTLLPCVLQSYIWELFQGYGGKGNIADENGKEAFWKTALRCVNATHRVTPFSSVFSVLTQFSENLQWDTSERNEDYGEKGNNLRWKLERILPRNLLVMCEFISQNYTYVSWSSPITLSLRNLRRASLDRIEAYAEKGNFIRSNRERNFLRNYFLIGEFISKTFNLDFRK